MDFCGFHNNFTYSGVSIKYFWSGLVPTSCLRNCGPAAMSRLDYVAPSADKGTHAALSIFAHELAEAASDPEGLSWWERTTGLENADMCNGLFGALSVIPVAAYRNVRYNLVGLKGAQFIIQQNWDPVNGRCTSGVPYISPPYPPPSPRPPRPPPPAKPPPPKSIVRGSDTAASPSPPPPRPPPLSPPPKRPPPRLPPPSKP